MKKTDSDSLPRSSSEPNLSKTKQSHLPPSSRSTCSSKSAKKEAKSRARKRGSKSKNSNLTEESLEEFNRRNEAELAKKISNTSPYYKGLTDSTLIITRQRHSISSPGRESFVTTGSSSSISTFFNKIQDWSNSCFKSKSDPNEKRSVLTTQPLLTSSSTSRVPISEVKETSNSERKETNSIEKKSLTLEEKPLRERVPIETAEPSVIVGKRVIVVQETLKEATIKEKEREFVWADKYRPKALEDFICNKAKADELQDMVRTGECNHFIFEGLPGVGKRTMIWALLREVFGPEILAIKEENKEFELKGESIGSIQVKVKESPQHVEVNISELCGYEKHVIVSLVKETHTVVLNQAVQCNYSNCRAIILYEADKLSTDAQLYIRWLLERYRGCNKVFFCCSDASKLQPIRSLCTVIQLLPPSNKEIIEVLDFIAKQEDIELPQQLAEKIAGNSKNNLRQAIRSFEASWQLNYPFKEDQEIMTGWEEDIANIAKNIIEEQSPRQLYVIRGKLQNLIEHNVSPDFIFSTLVVELKKHLDNHLHSKIDVFYQEYNWDNDGISDGDKTLILVRNCQWEASKRSNDPVRKNVQHFMKIEEFTAKFMSFYKSSVMKNTGLPIRCAV